jgi:NADH dehydrogenase [ubiquinone] 1 alpha subcomplex assembly factor 1
MKLFKFSTESDLSQWKIVGDFVMGGVSNGNIRINDAANGEFSGTISLENNGGFSMVQYFFDTRIVNTFTKASIRLKGDGKTYQFRIKTNSEDKHSYVSSFNTTANWETIEIPFNKMIPTFRGKKLDLENYPGNQMEQIAFLIGNKKEEAFKLELDFIELK